MPPRYTVLYVDDEEDLLKIGKMFLETSPDLSVDTSDSAIKALAVVREHRPDAIVSDFEMPKMDGIAFLKEIRSAYGDLPFIIFTGRSREEVAIDALNNGADFYIQKGSEPDTVFAELIHVIRKAIRAHQAQIILAEQEQRYHDLQNATDLIQSVSPDGRFLFVNRKWQDILGYREADLSAITLFDIIHEESRGHCSALFPRVIAGEDVGIIDVVFRARDGSKVYVEGFASCKIADGKPQYTRGIFKDVTDRKQMEAALSENRDYLDQIFSSIQSGIFIIDAKSHEILDLNPAAAKLMGLPKEQILHKACHGFICTTEEGQCPITDLRLELDSAERIFLTADGRKVPIIKYVVPFTFRGRKCLLETIVDNTERKKAADELRSALERVTTAEEELRQNYDALAEKERALRESEQKYRLLTEVTPDVIYMIDPHGTVLHVSPQIARYGYSPGEIISHNFTEFLAEEDVQKTLEDMKKTLSSGKSQMTPMRIRDKTGGFHWLEDNGTPVRDPSGSVTAITGILRDITERKSAEDALRESEAKFRALVENSLEGIFITDFSGTLLFVNQAAGQIIECTDCQSLIGKRNVMEFVAPESREGVLHDIGQVARGIDAYLVHYKIITETNREILVECIGRRIPFGGNPAMLVSMRDISERRGVGRTAG